MCVCVCVCVLETSSSSSVDRHAITGLLYFHITQFEFSENTKRVSFQLRAYDMGLLVTQLFVIRVLAVVLPMSGHEWHSSINDGYVK